MRDKSIREGSKEGEEDTKRISSGRTGPEREERETDGRSSRSVVSKRPSDGGVSLCAPAAIGSSGPRTPSGPGPGGSRITKLQSQRSDSWKQRGNENWRKGRQRFYLTASIAALGCVKHRPITAGRLFLAAELPTSDLISAINLLCVCLFQQTPQQCPPLSLVEVKLARPAASRFNSQSFIDRGNGRLHCQSELKQGIEIFTG